MLPDRILAQSTLPRLKNRKAKKNLIPSKTSKVFPFREPERESEEGQTRYESVSRDVETEGELSGNPLKHRLCVLSNVLSQDKICKSEWCAVNRTIRESPLWFYLIFVSCI